MSDPIHKPEPSDSGSAGVQQIGTQELLPAAPADYPYGRPLTDAIKGIQSSNPKSLGGEASSTLLVAITSHLSDELETLRRENRDLSANLTRRNEELADYRVRVATLEEQTKSANSDRVLTNIMIALGSILLGIGLSNFEKGMIYITFSLIGAGLSICGWFLGRKGEFK